MTEYEYAMFADWLRETRPYLPPRTLPFTDRGQKGRQPPPIGALGP
jgi:hypothetical protein